MNNTDIYKKIADNIRNVRNLKGFSQEYVANELGISQKSYSLTENGETKPDIERIIQIANIFKIEPIELLKLDNGNYIFHNSPQSGHSHTFNVQEHNISLKAFELLLKAKDEEIKFLREQNILLLKQK